MKIIYTVTGFICEYESHRGIIAYEFCEDRIQKYDKIYPNLRSSFCEDTTNWIFINENKKIPIIDNGKYDYWTYNKRNDFKYTDEFEKEFIFWMLVNKNIKMPKTICGLIFEYIWKNL